MKLKLKKYFINILPVIILSLFLISCEDTLLGPDPENTSINNFDIIWKEFDRYYPSFELKHIDWDGLNSRYRKIITSGTNEVELWKCISGMLNYLNDIHVFMYNRDHSWFHSSTNRRYVMQFSIELIEF